MGDDKYTELVVLMCDVLLAVEWSVGECCNYCRRTTGEFHIGELHCAVCDLAKSHGHAEDCDIDKAINKSLAWVRDLPGARQ